MHPVTRLVGLALVRPATTSSFTADCLSLSHQTAFWQSKHMEAPPPSC